MKFTLGDLVNYSLQDLLNPKHFTQLDDVKYFSYVIGVLKEIFSYPENVNKIEQSRKGLYCHNYRTSLPMGKGVSSSAAVCVIIARIFNKIYEFNWDVEREIEYAFIGERAIGSECGKLDHACAYGDVARCLSIRFNINSSITIEKMIPRNTNISSGNEKSERKIYMLLIDLNASKDTIKILKDLNRAFSLTSSDDLDNDMINNAHSYLLTENIEVCQQALQHVDNKNASELGKLFNRAQQLFDNNLRPLCTSELNAPILHSVLQDETVKKLSYGGKGVGSGGDGSCLVCCIGENERILLRQYLEQKNMTCLDLTL